MTSYAETALTNELATLQSTAEGGRNAQLFKSAAALFGLVKGNLLTRQQVESDLERSARSVGLCEVEIKKTLESAWDSAEPRIVDGSPTPPPQTSKRAYTNLADYAKAHGVDEAVFASAKWVQTIHMERPCFQYPVKDRAGEKWLRYRFIDGDPKQKRFTSQTDFHPCWYGLDRALLAKPNVLVICNGAPSVIVGQHYGVPAVAQEGGENALLQDNLDELNSKWHGDVLIVLEDDEQGNRAAEKLLRQLSKARRVDLNLQGSQDLADFCALYKQDSLSELQHRAQVQPADTISKSITVLSEENQRELTDMQAGKIVRIGLFSQIPELDSAVGSFMPHRLHTILGATGMGKSTLAVSLAVKFLWQQAGLIVSTETTPDLWYKKMVAYLSGIPVDKIIEGKLNRIEAQTVAKMNAVLHGSQSRVYDGMSPEIGDVMEWVNKWKNKIGATWLMIDSISRLKAKGASGIYDRTTEVSNQLQLLARDTGLIIVGTYQVGRKMGDRDNKIPTIYDGKGSGSIEEDSDVIIPLYYHHYYVRRRMTRDNDPHNDTMPEGKAMIYVGKHRYREATGDSIFLQFKGGVGFFPWSKEHLVITQPLPLTGTNDTLREDIVF